MELEDKTLIITGASSGIGAAAARLFAREGARLVLGARREAELRAVARQIAEAGGEAVTLAGDVTEDGFAPALVALARDRFGGLDGAFNNAGTVGEMGPVSTMDRATWDAVIATNLTAAFLAAQAQVPAIAARGGGAIVFTSSFVGFSNAGLPGMGAYAASKAGINGLVQSLAADHAAQGVRVHSLMPGGTLTALAGDDPAVQASIAALHPMKRLAQPEEIAQAALFLLSDRAGFMTGSPVLVDGGMSVRLL